MFPEVDIVHSHRVVVRALGEEGEDTVHTINPSDLRLLPRQRDAGYRRLTWTIRAGYWVARLVCHRRCWDWTQMATTNGCSEFQTEIKSEGIAAAKKLLTRFTSSSKSNRFTSRTKHRPGSYWEDSYTAITNKLFPNKSCGGGKIFCGLISLTRGWFKCFPVGGSWNSHKCSFVINCCWKYWQRPPAVQAVNVAHLLLAFARWVCSPC